MRKSISEMLVGALAAEDKIKCNYLVILVYAPKPCRASFSISFTSEQYLSIKQQTNFEVFSKTHIRELFGDDFDCYK